MCETDFWPFFFLFSYLFGQFLTILSHFPPKLQFSKLLSVVLLKSFDLKSLINVKFRIVLFRLIWVSFGFLIKLWIENM